jgi:hypothetical protein
MRCIDAPLPGRRDAESVSPGLGFLDTGLGAGFCANTASGISDPERDLHRRPIGGSAEGIPAFYGRWHGLARPLDPFSRPAPSSAGPMDVG